MDLRLIVGACGASAVDMCHNNDRFAPVDQLVGLNDEALPVLGELAEEAADAVVTTVGPAKRE